jgi:diguanylate cyclase (GGDEF)-like protein
MNTQAHNTTQYTPHSIGSQRPSSGSPCVVVIRGEGLGQCVDIGAAPLRIGRSPQVDLVFTDKSVSRQHCQIWSEGEVCHIRDLGATNPTRVNGLPLRGQCRLSDGDQITVGQSILKFISSGSVEVSYHEAIYQLATRDALTGLDNRRYFIELADKEIIRAIHDSLPLCLCIVDVDLFKWINDQYGHLAGDEVLKQIATLLRRRVRDNDIVARIGGEEFALLLPDCAVDDALQLADQLRQAVASTVFTLGGESRQITVSIGVAGLDANRAPGLASSVRLALMADADAALYRAKSEGRNRVCVQQC